MKPPVYLETDSMETALQVTATSSCYMLISDALAPSGSPFYPLREHENLRHFYACFRQGYPVPPYTRAFLDLVREEVARRESRAAGEADR